MPMCEISCVVVFGCAIAAVLAVLHSPLSEWLCDTGAAGMWPLCLHDFAHRVFVHCEIAGSHNTVLLWTEIQNKHKVQERQLYEITDISVLKLVHDSDQQKNTTTPMQAAKAVGDLADCSGAGSSRAQAG